MLLVTSDFDLRYTSRRPRLFRPAHRQTFSTPTEATDIQWQQAPNSALVVRHGDGHGTFFRAYLDCHQQERGSCELILVPGPARSAEIEFLKTGVLPHPADQQFVTIYAPGSVRGPVADPYNVPTGPDAGDVSGIQ